MSVEDIKYALDPEINNLVDKLNLHHDSLEGVSVYISNVSSKLNDLIRQSGTSSLDPAESYSQNPSVSISDGLDYSNKILSDCLINLKGIIPETLSKKKAGENLAEDSISILEFHLSKVANEENPALDDAKAFKELYTIKLEYNGKDIKENVQIILGTTTDEIPLYTIKHLMPYTKPVFNFSIPFNLLFNAQYARLFIVEQDRNLTSRNIFPFEIEDVRSIDGRLQLSIKSYMGTNIPCIIYEENSQMQLEVEIKAGQVGLFTFDVPSGKFCVYSSNYKRSNIFETA